jgi:hypothetical protein
MIRFACPACKSILESPDRKAGNKVPCPKCGQRLQIPGGTVSRTRTILGALLPSRGPKAVAQAPPPLPPRPGPAVEEPILLDASGVVNEAPPLPVLPPPLTANAEPTALPPLSVPGQHPGRRRRWLVPIGVGVCVLVGVIVAVVATRKGGGDDTDMPTGPTIKVTADELFAAYGKDVIAADKKYTRQMVEVANVSATVQKDNDGRYYLAAAEYSRFVRRGGQGVRTMSIAEYQRHMQEAALNTKYVPGIILYLDPREADRFSGLGDKQVTIRGECIGMTADPSTEPGYFVTLKGVRLSSGNPR